MTARQRLPNRRQAETFDLIVGGLRYTCTVGRFSDGSIGELFLNNHKSNSAADTNARDSAITFSVAIQHGADPEVIRRALCRDSQGRASGPLGCALDIIAGKAGGSP
jgi:ribonucleoside-diphosphate reductase alpha chain